MFQPFEKFKIPYVARLIELNKIYIVSQSLVDSGNKEEGFKKILFTDYDDIGLAEGHYKAVRHDPYASIITLTNQKHLATVKKICDEKSMYQVFWAVVDNRDRVKKQMDAKYKPNIRRYILQKTNWKISGSDNLKTVLEIIYGEFYLTLKKGAQQIRVKFEEIENI